MSGAVKVGQEEAKADDAIELWFFSDLSEEQRTGLIYLVFGEKIAAEAKNHGLQRICLRRALHQIRRSATTHKDALLREAVEILAEIIPLANDEAWEACQAIDRGNTTLSRIRADLGETGGEG